jgi:hypothetical protein
MQLCVMIRSRGTRALASVLLASILSSCGDGRPTEPSPPASTPPPSASTVAAVVTDGTGAALSVASPVKGQFDGPRRDDARVRSDVQAGYSAARFAAPFGCVSVTWQDRTATITFVDCTLPESGETIDGTLSLTFANDPLVFTLGFQSLRIAGTSYEGTVRVSGVAGSVLMEANLKFVAENAQTELTLTQLQIGATTQSRFADGTGVVSSPEVSTTVTLNDVTWPPGSCLPNGGSLSYQDNGRPVTITFTEATPTTGEVIMQIGNLPPFTTVLVDPCEGR